MKDPDDRYLRIVLSNGSYVDGPFGKRIYFSGERLAAFGHVLITKINGITLPLPEWHDTLLVPAAVCPGDPTSTCAGPPANINEATPGSITFRVYFNPVTVGCFVAHCHIIDHEDLGMMQRVDILPAAGQPSGCTARRSCRSQICRSCWR